MYDQRSTQVRGLLVHGAVPQNTKGCAETHFKHRHVGIVSYIDEQEISEKGNQVEFERRVEEEIQGSKDPVERISDAHQGVESSSEDVRSNDDKR